MSFHVNKVLGVCAIERLKTYIEPVRRAIITRLCFLYVEACACELRILLAENCIVFIKR